MELPKVVVIIINYKTSDLIQSLLNTVGENGVDISFVVVDNAATADSYAELLRIKDQRLHTVIKSEKNLGFTGGINLALDYMQRHLSDAKHFFLLNPDAFSRHNLITDLYQLLIQYPQAACISPRITMLNDQAWYNGATIDFAKGRVTNSIKNVNADAKGCYEVDVFSGCAALFDLNKTKKAGLFNETLFMYYDEADYSIKLKKAGYKILFAPFLQIRHDVSYTTRKMSFVKTYYMTRNKFYVFNTTMSLFSKAYYLLHELAFHIKNRRFKNALYHLKGFVHFKQGKLGQLNSR